MRRERWLRGSGREQIKQRPIGFEQVEQELGLEKGGVEFLLRGQVAPETLLPGDPNRTLNGPEAALYVEETVAAIQQGKNHSPEHRYAPQTMLHFRGFPGSGKGDLLKAIAEKTMVGLGNRWKRYSGVIGVDFTSGPRSQREEIAALEKRLEGMEGEGRGFGTTPLIIIWGAGQLRETGNRTRFIELLANKVPVRRKDRGLVGGRAVVVTAGSFGESPWHHFKTDEPGLFGKLFDLGCLSKQILVGPMTGEETVARLEAEAGLDERSARVVYAITGGYPGPTKAIADLFTSFAEGEYGKEELKGLVVDRLTAVIGEIIKGMIFKDLGRELGEEEVWALMEAAAVEPNLILSLLEEFYPRVNLANSFPGAILESNYLMRYTRVLKGITETRLRDSLDPMLRSLLLARLYLRDPDRLEDMHRFAIDGCKEYDVDKIAFSALAALYHLSVLGDETGARRIEDNFKGLSLREKHDFKRGIRALEMRIAL